MAFCRNCGNEVQDEIKFCPNCGAGLEPKTTIEVSRIDKYGKFYGIGLAILAFIDYYSDPAFLTIMLSIIIIAGSIFCFSKKYKLKGFTIFALLLALFCLRCGISQGNEIGLFKMPDYYKKASQEITVNTSTDKKGTNSKTKTSDVTTDMSGVDPDLKAFLDSYEDFIDDYVDFMKRYSSNTDNTGAMLTEYANMMTKYQDFANKVEQYNSDEMSTEDAKYYIDVTSRCSKKILEMY